MSRAKSDDRRRNAHPGTSDQPLVRYRPLVAPLVAHGVPFYLNPTPQLSTPLRFLLLPHFHPFSITRAVLPWRSCLLPPTPSTFDAPFSVPLLARYFHASPAIVIWYSITVRTLQQVLPFYLIISIGVVCSLQ